MPQTTIHLYSDRRCSYHYTLYRCIVFTIQMYPLLGLHPALMLDQWYGRCSYYYKQFSVQYTLYKCFPRLRSLSNVKRRFYVKNLCVLELSQKSKKISSTAPCLTAPLTLPSLFVLLHWCRRSLCRPRRLMYANSRKFCQNLCVPRPAKFLVVVYKPPPDQSTAKIKDRRGSNFLHPAKVDRAWYNISIRQREQRSRRSSTRGKPQRLPTP